MVSHEPTWLHELPVTPTSRAAVEALRGLIVRGESHIDIDVTDGKVSANGAKLTSLHIAAALSLIAAAAFHYQQACVVYDATEAHEPAGVQRAITAFEANVRRTLNIELHGLIYNGKLNGSMRVFN